MARQLNLTLDVDECGILLAALVDAPLPYDSRRDDRAMLITALSAFVLNENAAHSVHVNQLTIMEAALAAAEGA